MQTHNPYNMNAWIQEYQERGALWLHDGNALRPHALLSSGNHSDGFFNSELVMEDPELLSEASRALLELLMSQHHNGFSIYRIDRVVGPAMGAITLAHELAKHITRRRIDPPCLRAYVEKSSDGGKEMSFKRTAIKPDERVLSVEDVITTGGSVALAIQAIESAGGTALPFVGALVNRSGLTNVGDREIVALINSPMHTWTPEECPLCKEGSKALKPKLAENWALLNAEY